MKAKTVAASRSVSTDLVLPNETNHYGNMFGGELLARMDRVGTIAAVGSVSSPTRLSIPLLPSTQKANPWLYQR